MKRFLLSTIAFIFAAFILGYYGRPLVKKLNLELVLELESRWVRSLDSTFSKESLRDRLLVPCSSNKLLQYMSVKRRRYAGIGQGEANDTLRKEVLNLIDQWPTGLKGYLEKRVREVSVVRNLGASGYVVAHNNADFTILIDESVLSMKPNDWFRYKEGTIVNVKDNKYSLHHKIEDDSLNTAPYLLEGILIHELGHCIGASEGWTASLNGSTMPWCCSGLFDDVFEVSSSRMRMKPDLREKVPKMKYYRSSTKLQPLQYVDLLRKIQHSQFPTLYATVTDLEFFAEYFYAYMHCHIQQRPLSYTVKEGSDTIVHFKIPLFDEQNKNRFVFIKNVFDELNVESDSEINELLLN